MNPWYLNGFYMGVAATVGMAVVVAILRIADRPDPVASALIREAEQIFQETRQKNRA